MNSKRMASILTRLPLLLIVGSPWSACGPGGTGTGNPQVSLEFQPYSSSASAFDLIRTADASISSLKLCFKRLRFKGTDGAVKLDQDVRSIGEVTVSASGTSLGSVSVASGDYTRIEFDLDNHCDSGKSVQVMNDSGAFTTNNSITLRFEGTFKVTAGTGKLALGVQAIVKRLNAVAGDDGIKTAAETDGGDVSN